MRRLVLGVLIFLAWSISRVTATPKSNGNNSALQHERANSLASENSIRQMATVQNPRSVTRNSQSIDESRPYIDVRAYGAKGDGKTDDTSAIANAINAACAEFSHPDIMFPVGTFQVSQSQSPSTSPIFEVPCGRLTFRGTGNASSLQFARGPMSVIRVSSGTNPNNAPVFDIRYPKSVAGVTFRDLEIDGYNEDLWIYSSTDNKLENVNLLVQHTRLPDNSALKLTNTFWFEWHGGECATAEVAGIYCVLMTGETRLATEDPLVGLVEFDNLQGIGGTFRYDQRVNTSGSGPGNMVFRDIRAWEVNYTPMLYITNSTGNPGSTALPTFTDVTFDNVTTSDTVRTPAVIQLNSAGTNLIGVIVDLSSAGNNGPAIQVDAGGVSNCSIRGGAINFASYSVTDNKGNPVGTCSTTNRAGFDYIYGTQGVGNGDTRLRSDIFTWGDSSGPALRATFAGNRYAGVALDPVLGLMLNTGNDFGFGASIAQNARGSVDIQFPTTYPPYSVTGRPTTGGSIAEGTYYATMYSATGFSGNCNSDESAPSTQSAVIMLRGVNNAIALSWTLPIMGVSNIQGYCIAISTIPNLHDGRWQPMQSMNTFVSGADTTSYTLIALPSNPGVNPVISTLVPVHRFTPTSLGVNTTKPSHNLDVTGDIKASTDVIVGAHLGSVVLNSDLDGTIIISSASSASHQFAKAFRVAPSCIITPTSDPASLGSWWVTTSRTAVTANVHISGTMNFDYHCIGNPD